MTFEDATRTALVVAGVTTVAGVMLAAAPQKPAELLKLEDTRGLRVIGVADLALVPGLVAGRPRSPWMAARVGLNAAIGAYAVTQARSVSTGSWRLKAVAGFLGVASVPDLQATKVLHAGAAA